MPESSDLARRFLSASFSGVLSTHSQAYEGYPFGSVVPFCLDHTGQPLILISRLAQHTRNIVANPKVALTLLESVPGDVQQAERLTLLADVESVDDADQAASRYYGYFPQATGYHDQLDFSFYRLNVTQLRFIEGFGKARWLSASHVIQPNPFNGEQEVGILSHMNQDHRDSIQHYCKLFKILNKEPAVLCGIDGKGMVLRAGSRLHRVEFSSSITTSKEARDVLVELARKPIE